MALTWRRLTASADGHDDPSASQVPVGGAEPPDLQSVLPVQFLNRGLLPAGAGLHPEDGGGHRLRPLARRLAEEALGNLGIGLGVTVLEFVPVVAAQVLASMPMTPAISRSGTPQPAMVAPNGSPKTHLPSAPFGNASETSRYRGGLQVQRSLRDK